VTTDLAPNRKFAHQSQRSWGRVTWELLHRDSGCLVCRSAEIAVLLLALGAVFAAFAGPCAFATTIDIGGPRVPQVAGMMNMSGNLAAACPIVVGKVFQLTNNWDLILLLFAGVFLASAICWLFVNPQRRVRE
jgi:ACS family glucarate transporter-like MFS transporter/ACS family D-galactonate transporter-like MFS transporter